MKMWLAIAACAIALAGAAAPAAEPDSPARETYAASCTELARALNLQGEARQRFVAACIAAKERAQPPADEDPVLAAAGLSC